MHDIKCRNCGVLYDPKKLVCPLCENQVEVLLTQAHRQFIACSRFVQNFCEVHFATMPKALQALYNTGQGYYLPPKKITILAGTNIVNAHTTLVHEFGHFVCGHTAAKKRKTRVKSESSAWVVGVKATPEELRPPLLTIIDALNEALASHGCATDKINYVRRAVQDLYN